MRHYWVDRVEVGEPGVKATGRKAVGFSEDFFADHFPGNPVFPGVYLLEGMAQTAGALLGKHSDWEELALMVSIDRARFSSFARPGDVVEYSVEVEERTGDLATVMARATVSERKVAQARITFRVLPLEEMVPPLYGEQWRHTLSLLFESGGTDPGDR
ncbi:MAG: 3-hydroxyacyl-[acyl-carrier-protein] dehydratase FabZ [Gemmatimonadetes bacterium]|nr:beta-hydroxyacyl-ACP dehydratase [Gemmatimonadota bacterium]NIR79226.1 beta-hydroxyacyl-ACP dehydratase [Gemmatimonadota bacterium]NIT90238.1 beta-hydroxyacyl-ACP dehydratase [Gemmatimonadota bacterium]NIU31742.1 beta-hydroxyacyl-ACP dehydratase [Gemmatimonadota bacterium]NIU36359.1 3-hydroxyacyl-[acyl-carrier-protein] dehydratase FabZ [Gemmatimonadota bacterium]